MMSFRVTPDNANPYVVTATSRDVFTWERVNPGKAFGQLVGDQMSMVALYGLAYCASRRQGLFSGLEKEFSASVDIEPIDDDEARAAGGDVEGMDPTLAGHTPAT